MNWWQIAVSGVLIFLGHARSMSLYGVEIRKEITNYTITLQDRYKAMHHKTARALTSDEIATMTIPEMVDQGLLINIATNKPLTWQEMNYRYPGFTSG